MLDKQPAIPAEDFKRIIEDFIKNLKQREEELKKPKKAGGGFIEKPIYYTQKPGLEQIITTYRKRERYCVYPLPQHLAAFVSRLLQQEEAGQEGHPGKRDGRCS